MGAHPPALPKLRQAFPVWLKIALLSFGGPAGQIAVMHRILVEERRWISETRFLHALNYCMVLPGPEAQQLATFIGWLMHGQMGGIMAGGLFILPGALVMLALSMAYLAFGHLALATAVLAGLKAAVLILIAQAVYRLGGRILGSQLKQILACAAFFGLFVLQLPFPIVIGSAALFGFIADPRSGLSDAAPDADSPQKSADRSLLQDYSPPHTHPDGLNTFVTIVVWGGLWLAPTLLCLYSRGFTDIFSQTGWFFTKTALMTFGGAYSVLAYVAQQAVETQHWLSPQDMINGLGLAETTPGPLILVLQFIAFMAGAQAHAEFSPQTAGILASVLASWATFMPCFLWIFAGGPFVEILRGTHKLKGALNAISACTVGIIANLGVWLALRTLFGQMNEAHIFGLGISVPQFSSLNTAIALLVLIMGVAAAMRPLAMPVLIGLSVSLACAARLTGWL